MTEPKQQLAISNLLDTAGAELMLGKYLLPPVLSPRWRYIRAKELLERGYKWQAIRGDRVYTTDTDDLLSFIADQERLRAEHPDGEINVEQEGDDLAWSLVVRKKRPATEEELAEAQAIVDAGPPPEEKIQWRRPIKFQLNDAPSWNDPRGYTEMNPKKDEE